jgi:hypothetical protein
MGATSSNPQEFALAFALAQPGEPPQEFTLAFPLAQRCTKVVRAPTWCAPKQCMHQNSAGIEFAISKNCAKLQKNNIRENTYKKTLDTGSKIML